MFRYLLFILCSFFSLIIDLQCPAAVIGDNTTADNMCQLFHGTSLHVHLRVNKKKQSNSQITNNFPCLADCPIICRPLIQQSVTQLQ